MDCEEEREREREEQREVAHVEEGSFVATTAEGTVSKRAETERMGKEKGPPYL